MHLNLPHEGPNLGPVGPRIHPQRPPDCAGHADQALHPAQVGLGAGRDRAAEVGGAIHEYRISFDADFGVLAFELENHPRQLAVWEQHVASAAEEAVTATPFCFSRRTNSGKE